MSSYTDMGSMPVSVLVSRDPDRTGNFVCDGVSDNVEIQAAIDYVGVLGGGIVHIKRGTYSIATAIIDSGYNNITVKGAGKYVTRFEPLIGINGFTLTACTGWVIQNLEIDGNDLAVNTHLGIELTNVDNFLMADLYIHHIAYVNAAAYGIATDGGCQNGTILRVHVEECDHAGIMITGVSTDIDVIDCYGKNNANGGGSESAHFNLYGTGGNLVTRCNIINCKADTSGNYGAEIYQYCVDCFVIGGNYYNATTAQLSIGNVAGTSENIGAVGVTCRVGADDQLGIHLNDVGALISSCSVNIEALTNLGLGILVDDGAENFLIIGCYIEQDTRTGIQVGAVAWGTISGCSIFGDGNGVGIRISGSYIRIIGCTLYQIWELIRIDSGADSIQVSGCQLYDGTTGVELRDDNDNCTIIGNYFEDITTAISILTFNASDTLVKNNYFNNCTTPLVDSGEDTRMHVKTVQFQQGGNAGGIVIGQFIHADGSPKGWEIDAADEWAIALTQMPLECQQVLKIRIWAVALADPGPGISMAVDILVNAGGGHQPFTEEAISVLNKGAWQADMSVNDVFYWVITASDDADIGHILGGDTVEIKVLHRVANSNIATDAVFRAVEIEYV